MRTLFICIIAAFMLSSCNTYRTDSEKIEYSNLVDRDTQNLIKKTLMNSGIKEENVINFLNLVSDYNSTVGDVGLVKEDFNVLENTNPEYNLEKIDKNWSEIHNDFVGYNCRMTSFVLMEDLIVIGNTKSEEKRVIFMDEDAINNSKNPIFTADNIDKFNAFYGEIPIESSQDMAALADRVRQYWSEKDLSFKDSAASIITVWFHDEIESVLFVGHTGVLAPTKDGSLIFIEKISFSDPYQAIKFKDRQELNDYLMGKYDVEYNQVTARPFIMENDKTL